MSYGLYYEDEWVKLYRGDYEMLLGSLPSAEPIGLIVTDPPYGETSLFWDKWQQDWPDHMVGVAESMWCFGSMRMFLDHTRDFRRWNLSQDIVWEKHNGTGFQKDRFKRIHEHALHWYRGRWRERYHETPRLPYADSDVRTKIRPVTPTSDGRVPHAGAIGAKQYIDDGLRLQRSIIRAKSVRGAGRNETEKPIEILIPLIEYACPPGLPVLDPFAGSGSTLLAARLTGRKAIGIEFREEQCEEAVRRLSQPLLEFGALS